MSEGRQNISQMIPTKNNLLNDALVHFIAGDLKPLLIVDSKCFQK